MQAHQVDIFLLAWGVAFDGLRFHDASIKVVVVTDSESVANVDGDVMLIQKLSDR
jgi:hypothetical protein